PVGEVRQQRPHADAGGARRSERRGLVAERGARDVEVRPRKGARELLDEEAGGDRAAVAAARVVEVGDVALELLLVLVDERQLPHALARRARGGEQTIGQALIVREEPR